MTRNICSILADIYLVQYKRKVCVFSSQRSRTRYDCKRNRRWLLSAPTPDVLHL